MPNVSRSGRRGLAPWLFVIAIVVVLDQLTKVAITHTLSYGERVGVIRGFFDLTLWHNPGAAFSFLAAGSGWQRWFFTGIGVAAAIFIVFMLARHGSQRMFCTALSLIAGGALGNVVDRIVHGHVIDFLLFFHRDYAFPAFNVADSAITIGGVLLVLDELVRVQKGR